MKKGIGFGQRQNNADLQFRFRKSETCDGEYGKEGSRTSPLLAPPPPLFFSLVWREKGLGGLLERSPFPVIKLAPLPPPEQLQSLRPRTVLTGLEKTPFCKQWGEGKESSAFGNSADDFLNARLGPLVGPGDRVCFHSPHPIVQERKFQTFLR